MSFVHAVLGHMIKPRDLYTAMYWLGSAMFIALGLGLVYFNVGLTEMALILMLIVAPINLFLRPDMRQPIVGISIKKFELIFMIVILLLAWIFISVMWFRSAWAVLIALLLLAIIAVLAMLPGYAGRGVNPEEDERIRKIVAFSSADSWNIMAVLVPLLFILSLLGPVTMSLPQGLALTFMALLFTRSASAVYYYHMGDV